MPLQALSLGREVDVWNPRNGVVHTAFERAVNLLVADELWTVLASPWADAPFGIRVAANVGGLGIEASERVHVRAGYVRVGRLILDCRATPRWSPARWTRPATGLAARLCWAENVARPRAWAESAMMARDVAEALLGPDEELAGAMRRTIGRGPGLTPAGDDVLAGMFAALTSGAAGTDGRNAASRLVRALAPLLPSTTDISRHLLRQAARGLPGRALHDLGRALVEGAPADVLTDALHLVLGIGSTSGADACLGLIAGCRFSFLHTDMATA